MAQDPLQVLLGLSRQSEAERALPQRREERLRMMKRNLSLRGGPTLFETGATPEDVSALEEDIATDPYTGTVAHKRLQDIEDLNAGIATYNRPDVTAMRNEENQMALSRLLLPRQVEGEYGLAKQRIANEGQVGAAKAVGERMAGTQEAIRQRELATQKATRDRQLTTQKNADLLKRAQVAEKNGPGWLWSKLSMQPTGAQQAETLRQQVGGGGADAETIAAAQELADENPDMNDPALLETVIRQRWAGTDEDIQNVLDAYQAITGR